MSIKLTYFNVRARGELARMALAFGKKKYEEVTVTFEDWPKVKPTIPTGALPVLEINGKTYAQGMAIATYLAKECGLYSSDNLEALVIDQIVQFREDLLVEEAKLMFAPDDAAKAEIMKKLTEEIYPKIYGVFTNCIKDSKTGFAVGKKLTLADLAIHDATQSQLQRDPAYLDKYPELKALRSKVEAADGLKDYLAKRAVTPI